jgi:hypothetical protein
MSQLRDIKGSKGFSTLFYIERFSKIVKKYPISLISLNCKGEKW